MSTSKNRPTEDDIVREVKETAVVNGYLSQADAEAAQYRVVRRIEQSGTNEIGRGWLDTTQRSGAWTVFVTSGQSSLTFKVDAALNGGLIVELS